MKESPARKHMKHVIPCHVEKVTRQARIVYDIKGEQIYVLHCFTCHKEYESRYNRTSKATWPFIKKIRYISGIPKDSFYMVYRSMYRINCLCFKA